MTHKTPSRKKTPSAEHSQVSQELQKIQFERDLFEKKLHRLHDRYDEQNRKMEWILQHPLRFSVGRFYHLYIKRDYKL
jgi:hypothetical protein